MEGFRKRMEKWLENFAHIIYHNRIKTLLIMVAVITAMVFQIPKITIDTSSEGLLHKNDPAFLVYNSFRDQFGRDEFITIAINPPNVFEQKFLKKVKALHEDLEENVSWIDEITSIVNTRNTRGEADELIVADLLEDWPETEEDMAALKERVLSNPMYKNTLISEDGKFTTIVIKLLSYSSIEEHDILAGFENDSLQALGTQKSTSAKRHYLTEEENNKAVTAVRRILKKYEAPDFPVYLAGYPVLTQFLNDFMLKDLRKFGVLSIGVIVVFLFVMFRRISGVLLPLTVIVLSLLSTIGIMAAVGVPFKLPTQVLPSFILAVSVSDSVHILTIFYHRYQQSGDKEGAIAHALGHSGLAVVMTSFTTAGGLLSFSTADIAPVADIGVFASLGVMFALVYTVVLLPALIAFMPIKQQSKGGAQKITSIDRFLTGIGNFTTDHPYAILVVSALIMALSAAAVPKIRFSHDVLGWFPEKNHFRVSMEKIDRELLGSLNLEVIIDTGKENGLYEPAILNRLEKAAVYVESLELEGMFAGKAWSLTTILKEINQALNENRSDFYVVPQNRDLVAQEFLLFENSGSDDLKDLVDSQFSLARFTIKVPHKDANKYAHFMGAVNRYFKENFPETKITVTGMMALLSRTISNVIMSMAKSYVFAIALITILMILLIGRVRIGLLSMIPNIAPILLTLGLMGTIDIPLDLGTIMVVSIAIGLAVDDTIHFMHNFRRYYEESGDPKAAVHETLHTTGRAMLVTSIILSLGFFVYNFATLKSISNFGLLTAFSITMALAADYFITPALMVVVNRREMK